MLVRWYSQAVPGLLKVEVKSHFVKDPSEEVAAQSHLELLGEWGPGGWIPLRSKGSCGGR